MCQATWLQIKIMLQSHKARSFCDFQSRAFTNKISVSSPLEPIEGWQVTRQDLSQLHSPVYGRSDCPQAVFTPPNHSRLLTTYQHHACAPVHRCCVKSTALSPSPVSLSRISLAVLAREIYKHNLKSSLNFSSRFLSVYPHYYLAGHSFFLPLPT